MGHRRRIVTADVSCTVQGKNYQQLDERAREYAARFFGCSVTELKILNIPHARVTEKQRFAEDPEAPEKWEATFRVGRVGDCEPGEPEPVDDDIFPSTDEDVDAD
jgi:hypothetical protein